MNSAMIIIFIRHTENVQEVNIRIREAENRVKLLVMVVLGQPSFQLL